MCTHWQRIHELTHKITTYVHVLVGTERTNEQSERARARDQPKKQKKETNQPIESSPDQASKSGVSQPRSPDDLNLSPLSSILLRPRFLLASPVSPAASTCLPNRFSKVRMNDGRPSFLLWRALYVHNSFRPTTAPRTLRHLWRRRSCRRPFPRPCSARCRRIARFSR